MKVICNYALTLLTIFILIGCGNKFSFEIKNDSNQKATIRVIKYDSRVVIDEKKVIVRDSNEKVLKKENIVKDTTELELQGNETAILTFSTKEKHNESLELYYNVTPFFGVKGNIENADLTGKEIDRISPNNFTIRFYKTYASPDNSRVY